MINFLKKQINKIIIWILIIVVLFLIGLIFKIPISILISTLSFVTSIFIGFLGKTWLEDYKLEINKELEKNKNELSKELEEYKTKLTSYTLVTKLQYDLEFKVYTELAFKITDTLESLSKFTTSYKLLTEKSLKEESEKNILELLNTAIKYKPFYPKPIYEIVENITNEMAKVYGEKSNKKNTTNEIYKKYEKYSELVRIRIENMKIIED